MSEPAPLSLKSQALLCLTVVVMMLPFLLLLNPQVPIYVGVLILFAIGVPILLWGSRMQKREPLTQSSKSTLPFLPTAEDWYTLLAWTTCFALMILPIVLIGLGLMWIPAGDQWSLVIARLFYLLSTIGLTCWWWRRMPRCFASDFNGIFPRHDLEMIHKYLNEAHKTPTRRESLTGCLSWLAVSAIAFAFATDLIDIRNFQIVDAPKRLRGLAALINWCRGNPNFTRSSLGIVTVIGVVMGAIRFRELRSSSRAQKV